MSSYQCPIPHKIYSSDIQKLVSFNYQICQLCLLFLFRDHCLIQFWSFSKFITWWSNFSKTNPKKRKKTRKRIACNVPLRWLISCCEWMYLFNGFPGEANPLSEKLFPNFKWFVIDWDVHWNFPKIQRGQPQIHSFTDGQACSQE